MTPSKTAWPPTVLAGSMRLLPDGAVGSLCVSGLCLFTRRVTGLCEGVLAITPLKTLDTTARVNELLLASEERVALVAELDPHFAGLGAPGLECIST